MSAGFLKRLLGQKAMAASSPVVIASDQSPIPVTGAAAGTEYTEGDTDASITGGAVLMEVAANTLQPIQGTVADGLLVNLGSNNDVTVSGVSTAANQTTIIGHVDGIETVLGTIDADTGNISTKIDTIAGAVSGTKMQVDVLTMPTVTVNAHAVTNAGTFAVQVDGAALTSLQLIDDTVTTLGTDTYTEATSKGLVIGAVRRDADTTLVNTTNEIAPLQVDANGRLKVEAFSGETLPVSLTSTTVTGTVAVTQSGTWDEVGINDSGNSITVDASNLDIRDLVAATDAITVHGDVGVVDQLDLTNTNPLAVAIVDGAGDQITSFGGGTQYTEDVAAAADPVGTVPILVRKDTPATTVSADGDNIAQRGTNYGAAYVTLLDTAGSPVAVGGGTQYTEDVAAAADPIGTAPILVRKDTPATITSADGDNVAQRGTNYGAAYVQVVNSSGAYVDTFGGGTQYTEGDTDVSITGTALMLEGAANALVAAPGTAADGMLVNLGTNNDVTVTSAQAAATTQNITSAAAQTGVSVSGYGYVLVTIRGTYAGVNIRFEGSPDGTNYFTVTGSRLDQEIAESTSGVLVANTTRAWVVPVQGMTTYRTNCTAYTSGTAVTTVTAIYAAPTYKPGYAIGAASTAVATNLVVKASPGLILSANMCKSGSGSPTYMMLFDAASLPSNGTVPRKAAVLTTTTGNVSMDFTPNGIYCSTGIVLAASSTQATLTIHASSLFTFYADYL